MCSIYPSTYSTFTMTSKSSFQTSMRRRLAKIARFFRQQWPRDKKATDPQVANNAADTPVHQTAFGVGAKYSLPSLEPSTQVPGVPEVFVTLLAAIDVSTVGLYRQSGRAATKNDFIQTVNAAVSLLRAMKCFPLKAYKLLSCRQT